MPEDQTGFLYPPAFAVLMMPFAAVFPTDYRLAGWLWAAIGAAILAVSVVAVVRAEGLDRRFASLPRPQALWFLGSCCSAPSPRINSPGARPRGAQTSCSVDVTGGESNRPGHGRDLYQPQEAFHRETRRASKMRLSMDRRSLSRSAPGARSLPVCAGRVIPSGQASACRR